MQALHLRKTLGHDPATPLTDAVEAFHFELIEALLERLTGKGVEVFEAEELSASIERVEEEQVGKARRATRQRGTGRGQHIYRQSPSYDADKAELNLQAQVLCGDGRELELDVELAMPYVMLDAAAVEVRGGSAFLAEPLQLRFGGQSRDLPQQDYTFDLELADQGRGTGHEVDEAYAFDGDYEDWSDAEEDPYYSDDGDEVRGQLRVWAKDPLQGRDYLLALGEVDDDTLFLGHVQGSLQLVAEREVVAGQLEGDAYYVEDDEPGYEAYGLRA